MRKVATFPSPSANSLTLVPTGTTEYIAAGDSQAAVPFPTEVGRDFDLLWKMASNLSYLLLQQAVTTGKWAFRKWALRRPHPARREVTCGDTDMDWPRPGSVLHTTGPWGRSYLGVGRRAASRAWQKALSKGRHRFTVRENLPWKNTRMGLPKGNQAIRTRTPSPVQGPAPPSLTAGGAGGTPPGFTVQGTELEEEEGASIPGWGGMSQQAWPPARYSRLPGQAWPSALGPVRRWRQHPRGAAPPNLHPQRT